MCSKIKSKVNFNQKVMASSIQEELKPIVQQLQTICEKLQNLSTPKNDGRVTKVYKTNSACFSIFKQDFDIIDQIYVLPETTGKFELHIAGQLIDVREPSPFVENGMRQLCFLGKNNMNILNYRLFEFSCVSIKRVNNEEVFYEVHGNKCKDVEELMRLQGFKGTVDEFLNHNIEEPVVTCGQLNYLRYREDMCGIKFAIDIPIKEWQKLSFTSNEK